MSGSTIDNSQLMREIQHAIAATVDFAEALQAVLQRLQRLIPFARADVMEYDFESEEILLLASTDFEPLPLSYDDILPLSFSEHPFSDEWQEVSYFPNLRRILELSPLQRIMQSKDTCAFAVAALYARGRLLGALTIGSSEPDAFHTNHLQILQEVADLVSLRLFVEQREKQQERNRLNLEALAELRTDELEETIAKLAEANRLKNEFLATISHELRTPLSSILGKVESLQEEIYGPLTPKQQRATDVIFASSQKLLTLINNLLDISYMETDRLSLHISEIDVVDACRDVLATIRRRALGRQLRLATDIPDTPLFITADKQRFQQILFNLLDNAVKFTPPGGEVGLEIRADAADDKVHFIVWDTGIGISPDKIDFIFMLFTQVDGRLSREFEGSGLGLPLAYRLAQLHDGQVTVTSEIGKGSRFTVTLPTAFTSIESVD